MAKTKDLAHDTAPVSDDFLPPPDAAPPEELLPAPPQWQPAVTRFYRVQLTHAVPRVVAAVDEANAWQAYCAQQGLIQTENRHEVLPATAAEFAAQQAQDRRDRPTG